MFWMHCSPFSTHRRCSAARRRAALRGEHSALHSARAAASGGRCALAEATVGEHFGRGRRGSGRGGRRRPQRQPARRSGPLGTRPPARGRGRTRRTHSIRMLNFLHVQYSTTVVRVLYSTWPIRLHLHLHWTWVMELFESSASSHIASIRGEAPFSLRQSASTSTLMQSYVRLEDEHWAAE